jgi:Domain of unknown function (DUF4292)
MMNTLKTASLIIILLCVGCKSTKNISSSGEPNKKLSSKQIIKSYIKNEVKFKTLQSRIKIEYVQGDKSQAHTVNLRIEKDKTIWMSATLGIVRAKITPSKVSFYNKLDNTYFDGDFSLISDLLGTEINFDNLQSLLLGETLFNLEEGNYIADIDEKSYVLHPKRQNELLEIFLLINPLHFKMDSQQLSQISKRRLLQIDYKQYQEVSKQVLPKRVSILALEGTYETVINIDFKSIALDVDLRFPFRIPSGFDEIVIR